MQNQNNDPLMGSNQGDRAALMEKGRRFASDASALRTSLSELIQETQTTLCNVLEERPYFALGIATGVGYVLGGGLSSRLSRVLIGVGGRALFKRLTAESMGTNPSPSGTPSMEH